MVFYGILFAQLLTCSVDSWPSTVTLTTTSLLRHLQR